VLVVSKDSARADMVRPGYPALAWRKSPVTQRTATPC
jgi:hypothetical protein